jgi:bifunctional UDP-N-acetylglucosamine pyrophosphorylase/glucosamine-1-phosphate N-acetyltransferase
MVLPGDHPLFETAMLCELARSHQRSRAVVTLCTLTVPHFKKKYRMFSDYGRIRRDPRGKLAAIVEVKDADTEERRIKEVNVGCYCFRTAWLWKNIDNLMNDNAAGELYLTDLARTAVAQKARTNIYALVDPLQGMGFNTPEQLELIRNQLRFEHDDH